VLVSKKIIAVLDDLFFTVKIIDAAKRAGLEVTCVKEESLLLELSAQLPTLIIFDLNTKAVNAVKLIHKLKHQPETRPISLLGFVSHVQVDLKQRAIDAGADIVLPRSTFSTTLPSILNRHAQALAG
jgi:PleD family two-component response regulator